MELDPLEEHLLDALRALPAREGRRCGRGRGDLACPGAQPALRLRRPRAEGHRAELLLDRLGGPRVERGGRARAAADRSGTPPLPLRRVLPRAGGAGRPRRRARHPHGDDRGARGADRGRPAQGVRQPRAGGDPADLDDRLAPPARRRGRVRDRACEEARGRAGLGAGRGRRLLVRRRLRQPRRGAGRPEQRRAPRLPGAAAAAPLRVRGQRARDQRALAAGLGRVRAPRAALAPVRVRVRRRPGGRARNGRGARRVDPRAPRAGRAAPARGALPEPRGRRRRGRLPHAAGDPRGLGRRSAARDGALARPRRATSWPTSTWPSASGCSASRTRRRRSRSSNRRTR